MQRFDQENRQAFVEARDLLVAPKYRQLGLRHLLAAAAFAAVAAVLSAAAIIYGLPGIDRAGIKVETSVWGVMKDKPPVR